MQEPDLEGLLSTAQARVGAVRAALSHPRECPPEECVTLLREAEGYLEWLRDGLSHGAPARSKLRAQAVALAGEIQQTGILLEQAARYGRRWLERLRPMAPEYTATGNLAPLPIGGNLSLFG